MENFKREIFEQLGNLFYALAADQQISPMESGELKMLLRKDWLTEPSHASDDKVSEAAHLIGLTIDSLQNQKVAAGDAYRMFSAFYKKHQEQFSYALKQKVMETAESIVKIFPAHGRKSDRVKELKTLLAETPQSAEAGR